MFILIDLGIILFIALLAFLGYRKGLIKMILGVLSFIIAIIIALILYKPVSNVIIQNTEIDDNIRTNMVTSLSKKYKITPDKKDAEVTVDTKELNNLPAFVTNYIEEYATDIVNTTAGQIIETFANQLTTAIINLVVLLSIYIIMRILLLLVKVFAEAITELPLLKQIDKTGGLVTGLLKGVLTVYIVFALFSLSEQVIGATTLIKEINKSYIGHFVYDNNILLNIIFK